MLLNRAKIYYHDNKEALREKAKNKYRELSDEQKILKQNMEETDIIICLKKISKGLKNIKKIITSLKNQHNFFICIAFFII